MSLIASDRASSASAALGRASGNRVLGPQRAIMLSGSAGRSRGVGWRRRRWSVAVTGFSAPTGFLVFRSFLALSPVRGSWGHAGDAWFVDLEG